MAGTCPADGGRLIVKSCIEMAPQGRRSRGRPKVSDLAKDNGERDEGAWPHPRNSQTTGRGPAAVEDPCGSPMCHFGHFGSCVSE